MMRDFRKEAQEQTFAESIRREWLRQRIETIHSRVSAYDVLRRSGVAFNQTSDNQEEQFACPFHGRDNKPSARVFPGAADKPSHAWCYVCQERWDVISLWRKTGDADRPFTRILAEIEREYGIATPEMPEGATFRAPQVNQGLIDFDKLYEICENRLRLAKVSYEAQEDMLGFLRAGSVLDKVRHKVDAGQLPPEKGLQVLEQLRDRIGERIRA